jgi:hypothetical protein
MPHDSFANEKAIRAALDAEWDRKPGKMNWLGLEDFLVRVLNSDIDATDARRACREGIDAFTRRGHFDADKYFATLEEIK